MDPFTLSMQAAGTLFSLFSTGSQQKMIDLGRQVSQGQLEANLSAIRVASAESSLDEMKQLRQNIGSQIAIQAARGTASGSGSAASLQQRSKATFVQDERVRRMNLLSKESQLRAGNAMSALNTLTSETQMGQSVTKKIFNTLSTRDFQNSLFGTDKKGKK